MTFRPVDLRAHAFLTVLATCASFAAACRDSPAAEATKPADESTHAGANPQATPSSLRALDWANRRYRYDGSTVRLRDGTATRAGSVLHLANVAYGDLTGDGLAEAAVLLRATPSENASNVRTVVLVYVAEAGTEEPVLVGRVDGSGNHAFGPDDFAIEHVTIAQGALEVDGARDGAPAHSTYRWTGSALAMQVVER